MKLRDSLRGLSASAIAFAVIVSWVVSAWIVRNDAVTFRLRGAGLDFVCDGAETVFAAGPVMMTVIGVVLGAVTATVIDVLRGCRR